MSEEKDKGLLKEATNLARSGFYVFPLRPNSKLPAIKDYANQSTRDPQQIRKWWGNDSLYNIGISTDHFHDDIKSLLVVDIDNKKDKTGNETVLKLKEEGFELPDTLSQTTPTGGRHLIYYSDTPLKQGTNVLGKDIDTRGRGGYIVGAGSQLDGKKYSMQIAMIKEVPQWVREKCETAAPKKTGSKKSKVPPAKVKQDYAKERVVNYLLYDALLAVDSQGGDETTFKVACKIKDFGITSLDCYELMQEHWNARCLPPWDAEDLATKIENAYNYGTEEVGASAPEVEFDVIEKKEETETEKAKHPLLKFNENFAFITVGGGHHILWETTDIKGRFSLKHLNELTFHKKFASDTITFGNGKTQPITEAWIKDKGRRSYDGLCFMPGKTTPPKYYNLWRGFTVEPLAKEEEVCIEAHAAVDAFLKHALVNVCNNDKKLYGWLMSYFAHLIQKPWEKPGVSLVFRGGKGVGKNALIGRIGHLLGTHFLLTSNRRYLISNFNGHLENCLMFVLDEAFWSGDKQAEGVLKDLITGNTHVIERKGKEPYTVENCTRVVIIGNEEWLIPASQDERRYGVFDVGDGNKQDLEFFKNMRIGIDEKGGDRLLLRYLLDYDTSNYNINKAPQTDGLLDQKVSSLDPIYQWWLECITEGRLVGSSFDLDNGWQRQIAKSAAREAFKNYLKERQIRSRIKDDRTFTKYLKKCIADVELRQIYINKKRVHCYVFPLLELCHSNWEQFIGHTMDWGDDE